MQMLSIRAQMKVTCCPLQRRRRRLFPIRELSMSETGDDPRVPLAQQRTHLAFDRSRWASERTLMAWIRTSISLVTAGFAVDRFLAYLSHTEAPTSVGIGQHWYGLALVAVGVLLLLLATVEHFMTMIVALASCLFLTSYPFGIMTPTRKSELNTGD
jgi:uncharacterized membrane protein YidH (DUF202 family)